MRLKGSMRLVRVVRMCFTVELPRKKSLITIFPVAMRFGDTPVPIPNTTVKTEAADDTMLETAWESRWLPDLKRAYSSAG